MTDNEILVLEKVLSSEGPVRSSEFQQVVDLPQADLSRLLGKLVDKGVLERRRRGVFGPGKRLNASARPTTTSAASAIEPEPARKPLADRNVLLLSRWQGMFGGGIRDGVRDVLDPLGASCQVDFLGDASTPFDSCVDRLERERFDALIIYAHAAIPAAELARLTATGKPILQIGTPENLPVDTVCCNEFGIYHDLTLKALDRGARRVLFVNSAKKATNPRDYARLHGCLSAAARRGAEIEEFVVPLRPLIEKGIEEVVRRSAVLLKDGPLALVCTSSDIPLALIMKFQGLGVPLDDNISLCGEILSSDPNFQNEMFRGKMTCFFTLDEFQMGVLAGERVSRRLQGENGPPRATYLQIPVIVNADNPGDGDRSA